MGEREIDPISEEEMGFFFEKMVLAESVDSLRVKPRLCRRAE